MYSLNNFCNIITVLRKERGWTQNVLAEKLEISPQSISKWECGVGYPDVTLFPVIADVMKVPIGILFGENSVQNSVQDSVKDCYFSVLGDCEEFKVYLGNVCRVEFIEEESGSCSVMAQGDAVFLNYFDVEQDENMIRVNIKNPSGSDEYWESYDRKGFSGENYVRISTGRAKDKTNIQVINYLDLYSESRESMEGNFEVYCSAGERNKFFEEAKLCQDNKGLEENILLHRKQLEQYPKDVYFQLGLCGLLYAKYKCDCDKDLEKEIFLLCDKIEKSGKPDMQCGARRIEALMYVQKGDYDKAEELVNALPSYLCGRELLIGEVLRGDKKQECYKSIIRMLEMKIESYQKKLRE